MNKICMVLLILSLSLFGAEKKQNIDEVDHVALGALLLKDGHINRASDELKKVDLNATDVDFVRFYTLMGLVLSKQKKYKEANINFENALHNGQSDKSVYLYMAQNSFKLKNYKDVLHFIDNAGDLIADKPSFFALKAESFWRIKEYNYALSTLKDSLQRFPQEYSFFKQRFAYLVTLQLFQSALEDANIYIQHANPNERTSIAFISALRKSKQIDKAILLAEHVSLKYPHSAEATVLLAHLYLDKDMIQSAADLFDKASIKDTKYIKESAEMMRRAKKFIRALYKNAQILNTQEKLKQRVAIYLEHKAYERIIASHSAIKRSGLIQDESILYALAYSYYMVEEFSISEQLLKQIQDPNLFEKATLLRKNMQTCIKNHWECEL